MIEDLFVPHLIEQQQAYTIVKTTTLPKIDYENFITDMLADRQFLEDNAHLRSRSCVPIRCLLVTTRSADSGVLVVPDSAWVDSAAVFNLN